MESFKFIELNDKDRGSFIGALLVFSWFIFVGLSIFNIWLALAVAIAVNFIIPGISWKKK